MGNSDENRHIQSEKITVQGNCESRNYNLPNFHQYVRLKYMKLGYHYFISYAMYLLLVPLLVLLYLHLSMLMAEDGVQLWDQLRFNLVTVVICSSLIVFLAILYFMTRSRKIYLLDFTCYNARPESMCNREECVKKLALAECFTLENLAFQKKILERSRFGEKMYFPEAFMSVPLNPCMAAARKEAEMVMLLV